MIYPRVLTYHSHNVTGNTYTTNDRVCLYQDLRWLHQQGYQIIPLAVLIAWLQGDATDDQVNRGICLTFDDGPDFDFYDLEFPPYGLQRSSFNIISDFQAEYGLAAQPGLHATSFVIASPVARQALDSACLTGQQWLNDTWWKSAQQSGLWAIQNHSWDHNHPAVSPVIQKDQRKGDFSWIDTYAECQAQIIQSADYIAQQTGVRPTLFAYPYGQASAYLRHDYWPANITAHGCVAAFSTQPGPVTLKSERWYLPRLVCGLHWHTPAELAMRLNEC